MTLVDVDPELFYEACAAYDQASRDASKALRALDNALRQAKNMTGSDDGGKKWGSNYFIAAVEASVTAGMAIDVLVRMAALLRQTGVSHDQSEEASRMNGPNPEQLPPSDPGGETYTMRPPKDPSGGSRPEPPGWAVVMPKTQWIDGDVGQLNTTAGAWTAASSAYRALDDHIKPKMKQLSNSTKTPELADIETDNATVLDALSVLADALTQQAGATSGYADNLDAAQKGIEWELQLQTVTQAINTVNAATIGRPIAEAILKAAELEIQYSHDRIQKMLDGLEQARALTITVLKGVATTVTADLNTKINPILQKLPKEQPATKSEQMRENRLRGARAEARAGIDPTKQKESIPSMSATARNRIPDDLDKTNKKLTEVKNVDYQAYTDQINDFVLYTQARGFTFDLVVDNSTKLDPKIEDLARQGKINIVRLDFTS
ncbi:putative toxin [Nocardia sp. NPDC003482]